MKKQNLYYKRHKMYLQLFDYFLLKIWSCNCFFLHTIFLIFLVWIMTNHSCHCQKEWSFWTLQKKINKTTQNTKIEKKKGKIYLLLFEYFLLFDKGFLKSESVITINLAWNDFLHSSISNILIGVIIFAIKR
jgi:hypothetical protein